MKRKTTPTESTPSKSKSSRTGKDGGWDNALLQYTQHPENNPKVLFYDSLIVIIRDMYPKAKYHFLVLPRKTIKSIYELTRNDVPLLNSMKDSINNFFDQQWEKEDPVMKQLHFQYGFHAVPSMSQLHLHVISTDFVSPFMKTKKHWRSFTTEFFKPLDLIIQMLNDSGQLLFTPEDSLKLLAGNLQCQQCPFVARNMPTLKKHLLDHFQKGQ